LAACNIKFVLPSDPCHHLCYSILAVPFEVVVRASGWFVLLCFLGSL